MLIGASLFDREYILLKRHRVDLMIRQGGKYEIPKGKIRM